MIGGLVSVLKHLDVAHRGQRNPQIAVDRPDLLRCGQVQHKFGARDLQLRHPGLLSGPNANHLTSCPRAGD